MRIIAGNLKGKALLLSKSEKTRPLKDLVKESIFNLLKHSNKISFNFKHTSILDLYSGTGSFGLECLSREAEEVYFVEQEKDSLVILEKNVQKLDLEKKTKIFKNEVFHFVENQKNLKSKFDLIFFDPPFINENINILVELIFKKNLLKKDGIIIIHRNKKTEDKFFDNFKIIEERIYGLSKIYFGKFLT